MRNSSFDLSVQNQKIESRIVAALERISEAFRVLLWNESKENSLSPIQIQLLIFLLFHAEDKCKVSYLAQEFNLTKATISDSVRILFAKGLLNKEVDPLDTRSYTLSLSVEGKRIAAKASLFATSIEKPIKGMTDKQKSVMLNGLLHTIHALNNAGIITIQRMCFTCSFHSINDGVSYCSLLRKRLAETEIRLDCPEHEMHS